MTLDIEPGWVSAIIAVLGGAASILVSYTVAGQRIKRHGEKLDEHGNRMDKTDANIAKLTDSIAGLRDHLKDNYVPRPEIKEMFAGVHKSLDEVKDTSVELLDMLREALRVKRTTRVRKTVTSATRTTT